MNGKKILLLPPGLITILTFILISVFYGSSFASSSFHDVPSSDLLFSPYIEKLYSAHLVSGDTEGGRLTYSFRPRDTISRAEFTKVTVGVKLAEKYGIKEEWASKSDYGMMEAVLKGKLLYFHKCDNSDLPKCTSLCGADICGICNVCLLTNGKPFTDVKEKERDCEEKGICSPWYSEYIYYALRKGMLRGYQNAPTSWSFRPDEPILRLHALKLIMADSGDLDPEAYFPKCLLGAEKYILEQNGGEGHPDAEKLLKYALLADKLDLFGNGCQVFSYHGISTPEAKATFLHSSLTRQEAARYFSITANYLPIWINPFEDDTVDGIVSNTGDPESLAKKVIDEDGNEVWDYSGIAFGTTKVYAENAPIPVNDFTDPDNPFDSTFNREACILSAFTPKVCKDPGLADCINVPNGSRIHTTEEVYSARTPSGYYTWLWHGVIYKSIGYYVPLDDIDFECERTKQWEEAVRKAAAEKARIDAYNARVRAQNAKIRAATNVTSPYAECYSVEQCHAKGVHGPFQSSFPQTREQAIKNDMPWIYVANYYGTLQDIRSPNSTTPYLTIIKDLEAMPDAKAYGTSNPFVGLISAAGGWIGDNIGKPIANGANNYIVQPIVVPVHQFTVKLAEGIGGAAQYVATEADSVIMNGFNSVPDWLKLAVQNYRTDYNRTKGFVTGGAGMAEGVFQIYKDPIGVGSNIATAVSQPVETWNAIGTMFNDYVTESLSSQDKLEEAQGRLIFELGSFFVGAGQVKAILKTSEVTKIVSTADKVSDAVRVLERLEDAGIIARGLEGVVDTSKVTKVLTAIPDVEKTANVLSKMKPTLAAEVLSDMGKAQMGSILTKMDEVSVLKVIQNLDSANAAKLLVEADPLAAARIVELGKTGEAVAVLNQMTIENAAKILNGFSDIKKAATILKDVREPLYAAKSAFYRLEKTQGGINARLVEYRRLVGETDIKNKLEKIADKYNVKLEWNESTLFKEGERISEKAFMDYGGDITQVQDIFRTRFIVNTQDVNKARFVENFQSEIESVIGKFSRVPKNNFAVPTATGYRNLMMNPQIKTGYPIEIQLTVRELVTSNDATHLFTEATRKFDRINMMSGDVKMMVDRYGGQPTATAEISKLREKMTQAAKEINDKAWNMAQ